MKYARNVFNRYLAALLCVVALMVPGSMQAGPGELAKQVLDQSGSAIVYIHFSIDISFNGQEQSQESACLGTIVESSGIVLVANSAVNPNAPRQGVSLKARDFQVNVDGEAYEAKLIYKDAEKDYAFLRIGDPDDPEVEKPEVFSVVSFMPRELKIGESMLSVGRNGERENYAPLLFPYYVSGLVTTPKKFYGMTNVLSLLRGTPTFDQNGNAVGLVLAQTITTAAGRAQATNRLIIKPIDDLQEVLKSLPAPGEEMDDEEDGDEEEEEELEEEETDEMPEDDS